jgi:MFS family permease
MLIAESTEAQGAPTAFRTPVMLVAVSFFLVMIDGYDMFIVSFLAPLIAADLNLTRIAIGQMFAAGLAGSMIGGLVLGPVADRIGRRARGGDSPGRKSGELRRVLPDWIAGDSTVTALIPYRQGLLPSVRAFLDHLAAEFPKTVLI